MEQSFQTNIHKSTLTFALADDTQEPHQLDDDADVGVSALLLLLLLAPSPVVLLLLLLRDTLLHEC